MVQTQEKDNAATANAQRAVRVLTILLIALVAAAALWLVVRPVESVKSNVEDMTAATDLTSRDPFYVLLIGSDSRKGTALYTGKSTDHAQVDQHSDIMTLMRVDPETYKITLVSVPRDTVLQGQSARINDSLRKGDPQDTVGVVSMLTGVQIRYYMLTTFTDYEQLVDLFGGVSVDVPMKITVKDPLTAKNVTDNPGVNQLLDGSHALVLARARYEYGANQEALRQINVRNLETSLMRQLASGDEDSTRRMLSDLRQNTDTNMDDPMMLSLILAFVGHADQVTVYSGTGPYEGYERDGDGEWVVPEDHEAWQKLMAVVDEGGDPTAVIPLPSFPTS